jgi:hypothetical protein
VLTNPFSILQVHKQAFTNTSPKSYMRIVSEIGFQRLFTLGLVPSLARNVLLSAGFLPGFLGHDYSPLSIGYALGGILLSHPFEVSRVILQHNGAKSGMFGDSQGVLRGLYASEGLAGLYRGAVPRTIHLLPTIMTLSTLQRSISFE